MLSKVRHNQLQKSKVVWGLELTLCLILKQAFESGGKKRKIAIVVQCGCCQPGGGLSTMGPADLDGYKAASIPTLSASQLNCVSWGAGGGK